MISFENVSINYDKKQIIDNVSFTAKKGEFTVIMGGNGCGKSSLINALGQNVDFKGNIKLQNIDVSHISRKKLARQLSFLPQFNTPSDEMTVLEFISYGRTPYKSIFEGYTCDDFDIIGRIIKETELSGFERRNLASLSGGELQRVYLAMCLVQEPEVLILDEPTNHLDIKFQYQLLGLIRRLNLTSKITVLCILHDLNQAAKYADKIVLLKDHKIICQGKVADCLTSENIKTVFEMDSIIHSDDNGIHIDYVV